MRIGIMSDTHDNVPNITTAFGQLRARGVEFLLHAGDYVAPFSVSALFKLKEDLPFVGVLGNCDGELVGLSEAAGELIYAGAHTFELEGKNFFMVHDIERYDIDELVEKYDYIIHGHTHTFEVRRVGDAMIINPGECCGIITGYASCAILDTVAGTAEILHID